GGSVMAAAERAGAATPLPTAVLVTVALSPDGRAGGALHPHNTITPTHARCRGTSPALVATLTRPVYVDTGQGSLPSTPTATLMSRALEESPNVRTPTLGFARAAPRNPQRSAFATAAKQAPARASGTPRTSTAASPSTLRTLKVCR